MLVVRIELHSAITGKVTEIGRMIVSNDGKTLDPKVGNYDVRLARRGVEDNARILAKPQRHGRVEGHARLSLPVWSLVAKALSAIGFEANPKTPTRWVEQCHRCDATVHIGLCPTTAEAEEGAL